jgi:microcystin-dependent protein
MATTPYLGQVQSFSFDYAPKGWSLCNGQILPITQYQALFSLLGTFYGGDGRVTFALPNLQSRAIRGYGAGTNLSICNMGQVNGVENITITTAQMPAHNHMLVAGPSTGPKVSSQVGVDATPSSTNNVLGQLTDPSLGATNNFYTNQAPDTHLNNGSGVPGLAPSGGSQPVNIMQPFTTINFCIALQGLYPSRS